ncbi:hypothetical protein K443DRAFT_420121 [Laccaria amethystina LaAM-08-1]|uniref:Uncharacterized protein n=1 Tax=Laccaria amethystina LaAM-08-1 TaxID=1095629 RepID=A0A0C9WIF4_9AGAR|nr:hypothetical protein K443DRAFT_420121 [Laccaria amethystina LaAM-08-1]
MIHASHPRADSERVELIDLIKRTMYTMNAPRLKGYIHRNSPLRQPLSESQFKPSSSRKAERNMRSCASLLCSSALLQGSLRSLPFT